jgi:predicted nucleotidyltransferase
MGVVESDLVQKTRSALAKRSGIRLALLFGSSATRRTHSGSDLDLAVDAPGADLLALAGDLSAELGVEVDIVALEDADIPLLEQLVRDSVMVHEGQRGLGASWRTRALCTLETDRPWFRRMRDAWLKRVSERGFEHGR